MNTGVMSGFFEDASALAGVDSPNNRLLKTHDGQHYLTSGVDGGSGILLNSLNYANPIDSPTMVAQVELVKLNDDIKNNQTGTTYTIKPTDRGKSVYMSNAAINTITVDTNANQACVIDMVTLLRQAGLGMTSITAVAGVTLNGVDGGTVALDGQWKSASINQTDTDEWWIEGQSGEVF